ncbi:hypothetical protein E0H73_34965 [Kribbella pittospori]|uniref:N-acetyltransferase domain-containing protein n=1 Tax=Kribbella pittospori TaxID=722689 RepID=A0A4R0K700_9ACTN|nr:hypothetical protein [Kribbella pittospori]TCC55921.1 hypothetical protein E0H73_34965 [Kribbella pittospori]
MDAAARFDLRIGADPRLEEALVDRLVEYNKKRSGVVRERFEPANLKSEPVHVFALASEFYRRAGYEQYGVKHDYPPGHTNYFFRKNL